MIGQVDIPLLFSFCKFSAGQKATYMGISVLGVGALCVSCVLQVRIVLIFV